MQILTPSNSGASLVPPLENHENSLALPHEACRQRRIGGPGRGCSLDRRAIL